MLENGHTVMRKQQVGLRKEEVNRRHEKAAGDRGNDPPERLPIMVNEKFTVPFCNGGMVKRHKDAFHDSPSGRDLPVRPKTAKILQKRMPHLVAFTNSNTHHRPGKTRNCVVEGSLLKNLPFCLRHTSAEDLHSAHENSLANQNFISEVGHSTFKKVICLDSHRNLQSGNGLLLCGSLGQHGCVESSHGKNGDNPLWR